MSSINDALNPMHMEFAHMSDEITGKEMCALVSYVWYLSLGTYHLSSARRSIAKETK